VEDGIRGTREFRVGEWQLGHMDQRKPLRRAPNSRING
jgi:hypothetical protein